MRLALIPAIVALVAVSCSGPSPTTTTEVAATTAPTTTEPATTTTLAPLPFTALGSSEAAFGAIPDGPLLTAGVGRRLGVAFDDAPSTTVEWVLTPRSDGGTTLFLKETGFLTDEHYRENDGGWDSELGELVELLSD